MKRRGNVIAPIDSVNTLVEMLIQTDSSVEDGETVWVRSTQAMYVYRINSGLTPDGVNVIASLYGLGVWQKLNVGAVGPGSALGPFNTVAVGAAGSGRLLDVTAAQVAGLSNGTPVWVQSVQCSWVWESGSTLTADNITVCKPTVVGGAGRFVRANSAPEVPWRAQATWFVSEATGNDENDGTASATAGLVGPIQTYEELRRRTGDVWTLAATLTTINQVGNHSGSASFVLSQPEGKSFIFQGVLPAASFTGVLSAATALNAATKTFEQATSTWAPATEAKTRLVFNATKNAWSWVYNDLGGGAAVVSPWTVLSPTSVPGATTVNAAINDGVQTFALPTLGNLQIVNIGSNNTGVPSASSANFCLIQNLDITGTAGRTRIGSIGAQIYLQNCRFSANLPRFFGGSVNLANCCSVVGASLGNDIQTGALIFAGIWGGANVNVIQSSLLTASLYPIFYASIIVNTGSSASMSGVSFKDIPAGASALRAQARSSIIFQVTISFCETATVAMGVQLLGWSVMQVLASLLATMGLQGLSGDVQIEDGSGVVQTTALPFDTTTRTFLAARNLTFANLAATVATTGFGGIVNDPSRSGFIAAAT